MLWNRHEDRLALTGFSIASELGQERQAKQLASQPEATLPYISPEQTGRMNRNLDYRSDYYSLGVVLFERLTGQRPLNATTPLGCFDTSAGFHRHPASCPPKCPRHCQTSF